MDWHPAFMRSRYENWVEGLNGDWLVSRQRFFGVPIPVWYRLDEDGEPDYEHPSCPRRLSCPSTPPPTRLQASRRICGRSRRLRRRAGRARHLGDVLADPSDRLSKWERDNELFTRVFPYDLRPQGHDIIRTWLFSTAVRAHSLHESVPWTNTAISGWILDPDRKKMSKSKGNVVVPDEVLEKFGTDAVRYWAASAKLGADTAYEEAQMKIGRRLAIKLLNASKFAFGMGVTEEHIVHDASSAQGVAHPLDQALLAQLATVVDEATKRFDEYDYARALQLTEQFFWSFTDDYVELVKDRAYGGQGEDAQASVRAALATTLDTLLKLFAPVLPFATDEVWRWWRSGSVHGAEWPSSEGLHAAAARQSPWTRWLTRSLPCAGQSPTRRSSSAPRSSQAPWPSQRSSCRRSPRLSKI
ncbi:valine--tRNA ligase [Nesterenkonia pannonica]|uniref:valine--tRNA ligase n=1 Tax=Nesterenkonia pannonica TaxID=1548602 RepID=UPI0021643D3D|nr:valine--tRNA ligase [Nesterenkonia pannonica]